jgi:hypothetical protein
MTMQGPLTEAQLRLLLQMNLLLLQIVYQSTMLLYLITHTINYGLGINSASNRNEYQKFSWG